MNRSHVVVPLLFAATLISVLALWRTQLGLNIEESIAAGEVQCLSRVERRSSVPGPELWEWIDLPDDWLRRGGQALDVHYRMQMAAGSLKAERLAVLFPAVNLNVQLTVNGDAMPPIGRMTRPITHHNFSPLLFTLPESARATSDIEIGMRVISFPAGHGFLGRFCIGSESVLAPVYQRLAMFGPDVARAITLLSFVFALIMAFVWMLRRAETMYGWMAATLLFWTMHSLKYHVTDVPVSSLFWAWYLFATAVSSGVASYFLIWTFRGQLHPRHGLIVIGAWASMIAIITVLAYAGSLTFYPVAGACSALTLVLVAIAFARSLPAIRRDSSSEAYCLMLSLGAAILLVTHDNLLVHGFLSRVSGQMAILGVPILLGMLAYMVLRRLVGALDERERLLVELEARSQARARRIVDLEKTTALAEQRESIMRDMHDGLGGYLVSLLAIADRKEVDRELMQQVVQHALTDMRLMLDSLDIDCEDLSLLMGALRDRMQAMLQAGGLNVSWQLEETPRLASMSPHRALQVLRIVQECLNNSIKHARANAIQVRLAYDEASSRYCLEVADDGVGFVPVKGRGRGLDNMHYRAADIGATLELDSQPDRGTSVRLWLPADAPAATVSSNPH